MRRITSGFSKVGASEGCNVCDLRGGIKLWGERVGRCDGGSKDSTGRIRFNGVRSWFEKTKV